MGVRVRDYFGDDSKWDVNIRYLNQGNPYGDSIAHDISLFKDQVKAFVVMCRDTVFGYEDIKKVIERENSMGVISI
ncbi:MAG: hypothetical protein DRN09_03315 [Thermoplasmata archaeon]|nr:MAG: hypothetical protein DRN09_03315 [Thermoplasmata archaeon]